MKVARRLIAFSVVLSASALVAAQRPERLLVFPKLVEGQSFTYEISYRAETITTAESNVAAPMAPPNGQINTRLVLKVDVLALSSDAGKPAAHLRTQFLSPDASLSPASSSRNGPANDSSQPSRLVELWLHSDGRVTELTGFDALSAQEKAAWQEWIGRFGAGAALPEKGPRPGDKWRAEEQITNALLTGLSWDKELQYVNDEPCRVPASGQPPELSRSAEPSESCAVILTTATLKQKSPKKDATPDDYKLHELRTYGVAKGKNEVITYISRSSGLVVRSTEDANQSLDVMVAKSDGSNRVRYIIEAQSHARVLLLPPKT
jgi:hypothetical protein